MSRYYVDKFLYRIDRDADLLAAYMADPEGFVPEWETGLGLALHAGESSSPGDPETGLAFTQAERVGLQSRDYTALYTLGAHPFLLFTLMIAVFEPEYDEFIHFAHDYREKVTELGHPDWAT